jgi:hypothetical protein
MAAESEGERILRRLTQPERSQQGKKPTAGPSSLFQLSSSLAGTAPASASASAASSRDASPLRTGAGRLPFTAATNTTSINSSSPPLHALPPPRVFAPSRSGGGGRNDGGGTGGTGGGSSSSQQQAARSSAAASASSPFRHSSHHHHHHHRSHHSHGSSYPQEALLGSASESLRGASSVLAMTERVRQLQAELAKAGEERERLRAQVEGHVAWNERHRGEVERARGEVMEVGGFVEEVAGCGFMEGRIGDLIDRCQLTFSPPCVQSISN